MRFNIIFLFFFSFNFFPSYVLRKKSIKFSEVFHILEETVVLSRTWKFINSQMSSVIRSMAGISWHIYWSSYSFSFIFRINTRQRAHTYMYMIYVCVCECIYDVCNVCCTYLWYIMYVVIANLIKAPVPDTHYYNWSDLVCVTTEYDRIY